MNTSTQNIPTNLSAQAQFINPDSIVSSLHIEPGMKVADFGCGTGYFTFPIAKKIGNDGVIYALDILKEKLETVGSQARLSGFNNIITKRANLEQLEGSGLEHNSMDWVLLVNMLFQNKNKEVILEEAKRVLKKGGYILIIEWNNQEGSLGPDRSMRLGKEALAQIADKNGLARVKEMEISNFHYGVILSKYK